MIDPKTAKLIQSIPINGILYAVALDRERQLLYGAGSDGFLYSVNLAAKKLTSIQRTRIHQNYVSGMSLYKDTLISCGYDRKLVWSSPQTGKVERTIDAHAGWVRKLVCSPDGERIVTVGDDMHVKLWDAKDGKNIADVVGHDALTPEGYTSALYALAISPDVKQIATGDRAGFVNVWDATTLKRIARFRAKDFYTFDAVKRARAIGGVRGLAFSPDGSQLAVSGIGAVTNVDGFVGPCRIELWDWKAEKQLAFGQDKHQAIMNHVEYSADGKWLIAAGGGDGGGAIMFWPGKDATPQMAKPKGHLQSFILDGTKLYAVGYDGLQSWQIG